MEKSIPPVKLNDLLTAGKPITLLDVRRKEDFDQAPHPIAGAEWKNPAEIDQWLPTIPMQEEVIVYCVRGGSVSQSVQQKLTAGGRTVRYVEGGLEALAKVVPT